MVYVEQFNEIVAYNGFGNSFQRKDLYSQLTTSWFLLGYFTNIIVPRISYNLGTFLCND